MWSDEAAFASDLAWEQIELAPSTAAADDRWPREVGVMAGGRPYSGGMWWDEERAVFRHWYSCPLISSAGANWSRPHAHSWTTGCCYAESKDGVSGWVKPQLDVVPGTNIVLDEVSDGITVWRGPDGRWLLAAVPEAHACMAFNLYDSADGYHWTLKVNKSGTINDRSTIFYNTLTSKWCASIKDTFGK